VPALRAAYIAIRMRAPVLYSEGADRLNFRGAARNEPGATSFSRGSGKAGPAVGVAGGRRFAAVRLIAVAIEIPIAIGVKRSARSVSASAARRGTDSSDHILGGAHYAAATTVGWIDGGLASVDLVAIAIKKAGLQLVSLHTP
jgi:hypothetical protein